MSNIADIYALCYSDQFDFAAMRQGFLANQRHAIYRNVIHIEWFESDIFVFDYGVVVFWNTSLEYRKRFLDRIRDSAGNLVGSTIEDEFTCEVIESSRSVKNDHITLPDNDIMTRIAVCHAIAQSTKLALFEQRVSDTIVETTYIPKNIATTGSSKLRGKELAQMRGKLFIAKSDVMLRYDLLDVPDFFWEYPELDGFYTMLADYLEVRQRVDVLSKKLETIHELLEMISDEQKHKHSSMLEWIIIWLIAFEILVFFVHDVFKWL
ncbi:MAG: RMD1 family protein [Gammaproteobacteria bacterium]|nr:RMD1 family protein [Gammaproteobacteria bacterium]